MKNRFIYMLILFLAGSFTLKAAEKLKKVLFLADSITWRAYEEGRRNLRNIADVSRPVENPVCTQQALDNFEKYLGNAKWDVIVLSLGIHDLMWKDPKTQKCRPLSPLAGGVRISQAEFEKNLDELVKKLKATGATVIWCNIPPILQNDVLWKKGSEIPFNTAAAKIMSANKIKIADIHSHVMKLYEKAGKKAIKKFAPFQLSNKISALILPLVTKAVQNRSMVKR